MLFLIVLFTSDFKASFALTSCHQLEQTSPKQNGNATPVSRLEVINKLLRIVDVIDFIGLHLSWADCCFEWIYH